MSLIVEIGACGEWAETGRLEPGMAPGSMSNNAGEQRDVVVFRCEGAYSIVERSQVGVDMEVGLLRGITTTGFEQLARLADGEAYEMEIQTDRMVGPMPCRFRHEN